MQSKLQSWIEALINVGSGLLISLVVNHYFMVYHGCAISNAENLAMVTTFTVISIFRSYFCRRLFNWWNYDRRERIGKS